MNEPKGYWSSVFYQATQLMKSRPQINGETAFWLARSIVDQNLSSDDNHGPALPFASLAPSKELLVLAP
jgi:hypothetical protein